MKKIDLHLHVVDHAEEMIEHMKSLGIQKGVLMSAGEQYNQLGCNETNEFLCKKHPDYFSWMCNVDERDIDSVYERFSDCKKKGAIGVGELVINKRMDHPFIQEVFKAAETLDLPITIHMSPEEGYKYGIVDEPGLPLLEKTLQKYPKLKILGHSQVFWIEMSGDAPKDKEGRYKTGKGPVLPGGRIPELFQKYPNLYGDLSANSAGKAIMRDENFGLQFLETYADRLFFATDMLNSNMVYPLGAWLDEQLSKGKISEKAYKKICYQNAKKIFGL
jgi:predicted TIM-barrel fold metal-dependent hydrolase